MLATTHAITVTPVILVITATPVTATKTIPRKIMSHLIVSLINEEQAAGTRDNCDGPNCDNCDGCDTCDNGANCDNCDASSGDNCDNCDGPSCDNAP